MERSTYRDLFKKFMGARSEFQVGVSDALHNWLKENKNCIEIPKEYQRDFRFTIDGEDRDIVRIIRKDYGDENPEIVLQSKYKEEFNWDMLEDDVYIVDAVMDFYFGEPPIFNSEDKDE